MCKMKAFCRTTNINIINKSFIYITHKTKTKHVRPDRSIKLNKQHKNEKEEKERRVFKQEKKITEKIT